MTLSDKQLELIEEFGVYQENNGFQPAVARVMGILLVSDKPELTFEEISETLNISKSATSNALNMLLNTGHIEYTKFHGDRKRYFRIKSSNWRDTFNKKMEDLGELNNILKRVLEVRKRDNPVYDEKLLYFISFLDYLKGQLPNLIEQWEKQNLNQNA
ncbi:MarR family transcriptional regulator [Pontibacter sp. BT310]|uniref:MarR family transcriptional regulator n=1 Tax=Pontibacter populi TaxID=890055 RepID=A0ABS6X607_9BACT|nr:MULTISPECIES: MarR family transcriptional regulator [Pontibacter]MBJ6116583.1 MarR family transcriptional regulator [Pontibacter sp. BT310]MBR0569007.1 MarR family transcriptional regulator [Microvirga sp. STS03]MBW3363436.1 MarR family transcriptional regulator [Pontibacter populi]